MAITDIERCRVFLAETSPNAAHRAVAAIRKGLTLLTLMPEMGRLSRLEGFRELTIRFGKRGYIARYRYESQEDSIWVVALWHQREAGY